MPPKRTTTRSQLKGTRLIPSQAKMLTKAIGEGWHSLVFLKAKVRDTGTTFSWHALTSNAFLDVTSCTLKITLPEPRTEEGEMVITGDRDKKSVKEAVEFMLNATTTTLWWGTVLPTAPSEASSHLQAQTDSLPDL